MPSAKLSENFDVHIPQEIQKEIGLKPGQKLLFASQGKVIFMMVDDGRGIESMMGIAQGADTSNVRERP